MASISIQVGIDVSKDRLDVFIDHEGAPKRLALGNDAKGIRALLCELEGLDCVVAMEASGRYEARLRHELQARGVEVRLQNPRLVRRLAEGLGIQAKTDLIDAQVLAKTALLCAPSEPRSKEREMLGDTERTIAALKKERTGHLRRLDSPGFCPLAARSLKRLVRAIEKEIAALERLFEQQVGGTSLADAYRNCRSVPGVGPALARTAICELPEDLAKWSPRQISSYAGLAPMDDSSGKRQSRPRVGRHGNMHLKAALYMPAMALVSKRPDAKALYRRLRAKGLVHQQAIVAVMRRLLLRLFAVLKRGTAWQPVPVPST